MLYLILLVTSACGVVWMSLLLFFSGFGKRKTLHDFPDRHIVDTLAQKCHTRIHTVKLNDSEKPFGQMIGIPARPIMIISKGMYNTFTKDELEYIIYHEIGHYVHQHSLKELSVFLFSYAFCAGLLWLVNDSIIWIVTIPLLVLTITISNIQIARLFEREADMFAVKRLTKPHAMISATNKFVAFYGNNPPQKSWRRRLFYRMTPYLERITIAETELKRRK